MVDLQSILQNLPNAITASILTERAKKSVEQTIDPNDVSQWTQEDHISSIHMLLVLMLQHFKEEQATKTDIYKYRQLFKAGQGSTYKPEHTSERTHFQILAGVALTLNVLGTALGTFNITIPIGVWTTIDHPDGAEYTVDTSMAANSYTVYVRETSKEVN